MKLPLPPNTLPTLVLSPESKRLIKAVADAVVTDTIQQYCDHLTIYNGVVDARRWKKIRQREQLCVYKKCKPRRNNSSSAVSCETASASSRSSPDSVEKGASYEVISPLLVFGSIPGNLDDAMYGSLSPSVEEMQLRSAYMEDGLADWSLLASIIKPSEEDPFHELSIKWVVQRHPPLVGAVMRICKD